MTTTMAVTPMDRPALRRLMADIQMGKVDIVVVYKIDRLSRSLADFARMVDVFDRHRVSFSAVTQQINSATSMGRLMLNVLPSFAQFEREVTGERIRDKIAASKRKGMWMGGPLPLGYDVRDRLLVINETEAALACRIFDDFVTMRSATLMVKAYGAEGVVTKGGKSFTKQAIYKMLHNRMYRGEIVHKGQSFPGQHQAIVTQQQWDTVHALIATDGIERRRDTNDRQREPVLLRGLLFTPDGERLVPQLHDQEGQNLPLLQPDQTPALRCVGQPARRVACCTHLKNWSRSKSWRRCRHRTSCSRCGSGCSTSGQTSPNRRWCYRCAIWQACGGSCFQRSNAAWHSC